MSEYGIEGWEEYQEFAKSLVRDGYDKREHYVYGLVTEAAEVLDLFKKARAYEGEVDPTKLVEEVGDYAWYTANLLRLLGFDGNLLFHVTPEGKPKNWAEEAVVAASESLKLHRFVRRREDLLRGEEDEYRGYVMEKANERDLSQLITQVCSALVSLGKLLESFGSSWPEAIRANRRKLEARYRKGRYDREDATVRDAEAEKKALEGDD